MQKGKAQAALWSHTQQRARFLGKHRFEIEYCDDEEIGKDDKTYHLFNRPTFRFNRCPVPLEALKRHTLAKCPISKLIFRLNRFDAEMLEFVANYGIPPVLAPFIPPSPKHATLLKSLQGIEISKYMGN